MNDVENFYIAMLCRQSNILFCIHPLYIPATRDLHTVKWLDSFVKPITINNYWDENEDHKPGSEDAFLPNDKR